MPYALTDGRGLWSDKARQVDILNIDLKWKALKTATDFWRFTEVRVYFSKMDWNVEADGLIYTDAKFLEGVKKVLRNRGLYLIAKALKYSEHGMQSADYVSMELDLTDEQLAEINLVYPKQVNFYHGNHGGQVSIY